MHSVFIFCYIPFISPEKQMNPREIILCFEPGYLHENHVDKF